MTSFAQIQSQLPLPRLVQHGRFVGFVYSLDYTGAYVLTNDKWKSTARGIPMNSFLVAVEFDPNDFGQANEQQQQVVLLRVVGSEKLPDDMDRLRTTIDALQSRTEINDDSVLDPMTLNTVQFHGLRCRILGTFYQAGGHLQLGSDLESFMSGSQMRVYRPVGDALETIVNHVNPQRRAALRDALEERGVSGALTPIRIGTVRYTSTDRLHRGRAEAEVPFAIDPSDFLSRRTALFGMTRTGKSNTLKTVVGMVHRTSLRAGLRVGQLIFDVNGEYANPNQQDKGAIAQSFKEDVVLYRTVESSGFRPMLTNFYEDVEQAMIFIQEEGDGFSQAGVVKNFRELTLSPPPEGAGQGVLRRYERHKAAFLVALHAAGYEAPPNLSVNFRASKRVVERVNHRLAGGRYLHTGAPDPDNMGTTSKYIDATRSMSLDSAVKWLLAARQEDMEGRKRAQPSNEGPAGALTSSTSGHDWFDNDLLTISHIAASENQNGAPISAHPMLRSAQRYHSPRGSSRLGDEIYELLADGKIVILDVSVADPRLRERLSERIAKRIFEQSLQCFVDQEPIPEILIYIEEAHNLIGRGSALHETWPKLAKEGAKYRIGLVYATQEPSSMHPNILSNTENWVVTHLNNHDELRALSKFYDFEDFAPSLRSAQDVGFARVKTLSSPFTVPVQIEKFEPAKIREEYQALREGVDVVSDAEGKATSDGMPSGADD